MKTLGQILLLASVLAVACRPAPTVVEAADVEDLPPFDTSTQQTMARLSVAHAIHFLESNPQAILLDVRGREEYDKAHLPGAISFPYNVSQPIAKTLKSYPSFDTKGVYFIYGIDEINAINVSIGLLGLGYQHLFILNGGIEAWVKKEQPVTTTVAKEAEE